jgi:hypothetical protein
VTRGFRVRPCGTLPRDSALLVNVGAGAQSPSGVVRPEGKGVNFPEPTSGQRASTGSALIELVRENAMMGRRMKLRCQR